MNEPIFRAADIAWIRLRSPDLDMAERYLTDFGLTRSARTDAALYMRGTDPDHHIHITERGDPGVISIAFRARSEDDLHRLAREAAGASPVEAIDEPGGGRRVRLAEHNGLGIEVVWGVEQLSPLPVESRTLNTGNAKTARAGDLQRIAVRPSQVKRIGHAVIATPHVDASVNWARRHLGVKRTDDIHAEDDPSHLIASFNRIDGGTEFVDHHVMMFISNERSGLNHVSYEVQDVDDLAAGHDHLQQKWPDGHVWGIGRHTLGSQIFDYWKDPWGRVHEHWTDSDVLNDGHVFRSHSPSEGLRSQWGPQAPAALIEAVSR